VKIYKKIEEIKIKNPIISMGIFDGLHRGHLKILDSMRTLADKRNGETLVFTFSPHPRLVLNPEAVNILFLNTIDEKIELLKNYGINHLLIYPFTKEFAQLTACEFIRTILLKHLNVNTLVVGYNHKFGCDQEGNPLKLKKCAELYNFEIQKVDALDINNIRVSSSLIRECLNAGNVELAAEYLNYHYFMRGKVTEGKQIGRLLGFPTANIQVPEYKLIPKDGVYAVQIVIQQKIYRGMLNIGLRPTIDNSKQKTTEVHIFDFSDNIYHETLEIRFIKRIRDIQKFKNIEHLKKQLETDKKTCLDLFENSRFFRK